MKKLLTENFVRRVPKADLHLHLDGSLRLGTLIELARQDGVRLPSYEEAGLCETVFKPDYANLGEYLKGFAYTCAVLRTPENLERVAFELAEDCLAEGVRYIEVRFAPQLLVHDELSIPATVEAVARGLERARTAHRQAREPDDLDFEYGIILCAMRRFNKHMGDYYANLLGLLGEAPHKDVYALASLEMARVAVALRDKQGLPVVGFDLAGEEAGYPASYHTEAYQYVHSHFMSKTVHAGEAYGPESIFQALTECHANRIGHGTFLFSPETIRDRHIRDREGYVEQLVEYIARQRINIEVCLTSNQQTIPSIDALAGHPLTRMLEHNLSVSICTDNRLVSHTTMTRELMRAVDEVGVTPRQFRNIIMAGFKGSFFGRSYNERRQYVRRVMDRYDQLAVG